MDPFIPSERASWSSHISTMAAQPQSVKSFAGLFSLSPAICLSDRRHASRTRGSPQKPSWQNGRWQLWHASLLTPINRRKFSLQQRSAIAVTFSWNLSRLDSAVLRVVYSSMMGRPVEHRCFVAAPATPAQHLTTP